MTAPLLALVLALLAGPPLSGAEFEREARAIDAMLIAPCCFSQQVSVHHSAAAADVQRDVRARLAAGQSRQQILDAYVGQYGQRILAEPPAAGFGLLLYVAPLVIFAASLGFVVWVVRRLSRHQAVASPSADSPAYALSTADEERLDDELRDLD